MKNLTVAVVIPTIRDLVFLKKWNKEFQNCIGIIIEDHKKKEIKAPTEYFKKTYHYSWEDIDNDFGNASWIFPRKNAGIRSYGFLKAYQLGVDIIITLDDDCYPIKGQDFIQGHVTNLSLRAPKSWFPTYPDRNYLYTRGFPYNQRNKKEVVVSHGLWSNVLDFDAPTHLQNLRLKIPHSFNFVEFIPTNYFFPMSSMNLAFKSKITPLMYFPLMGSDVGGKSWGYDRFDDIWAGIFLKKIIDHLDMVAVNGSPFVEHKRASNPFINLRKEARGIEVNEDLYQRINKIKLNSLNLQSAYIELTNKIDGCFQDKKYAAVLKKAMITWHSFFKK